MGILNRVIAKASIQTESFEVNTIVTGKNISYTIVTKEQSQREDFGPFREIIVEGYHAKCSASFFSPYRIIKLDYRTMEEVANAVNTGDFVRSYLVVLDEILSGVALEIALNPYSDNKPEMEKHLSMIGRIKNNVANSKIVEDPILVMRRLQNTLSNKA